MENIVLFGVTVLLYSVIWWLFEWQRTVATYAKRIALVMVLCIPFNINGNVVTVIGNATAEKNIYSIFSLYQRAGNDTVTALSGLQHAGHNAITVFSLLGYQHAGYDAVSVVSLLAGYQHAGHDAVTMGGLPVSYQHADHDAIGVLGLFGYQWSGNTATGGIGLVGYQRAGYGASTKLGLTFYQKVGGKTRSFGVWSELESN